MLDGQAERRGPFTQACAQLRQAVLLAGDPTADPLLARAVNDLHDEMDLRRLRAEAYRELSTGEPQLTSPDSMGSPPVDSLTRSHAAATSYSGTELASAPPGTRALYPGEPDSLTRIRTALGIAGDRLALISAAEQPICVANAPRSRVRSLWPRRWAA